MNNDTNCTNKDIARSWNYRLWDSYWNSDMMQDFLQKNWNKCPDEDNCYGWVTAKNDLGNGRAVVVCDVCDFEYIRIYPGNNQDLKEL